MTAPLTNSGPDRKRHLPVSVPPTTPRAGDAHNPQPLHVLTPFGENRLAEHEAGLLLVGQQRGNATSYPNAMAAAWRGVTAGETAPSFVHSETTLHDQWLDGVTAGPRTVGGMLIGNAATEARGQGVTGRRDAHLQFLSLKRVPRLSESRPVSPSPRPKAGRPVLLKGGRNADLR